MRKYSKKGLEKRKQEREGFEEFFKKHITIIKNEKKTCQECNCRLKGSVREVAHILPKQYFKSIATEDKNIIYLCEQHHNDYDNGSNESIKEMNIFNYVTKTFKELEQILTEKLNWKYYDRWQH